MKEFDSKSQDFIALLEHNIKRLRAMVAYVTYNTVGLGELPKPEGVN